MDNISMVYSKYLKNYEKLNSLFGEGNWVLNNYLEQVMIYCAFFEIPFPTSTSFSPKIEFPKDYLYILYIDNPTFQIFYEKNPKIDKTKPILIHTNNNDEKIIIRAVMVKTINTSYVVLNKINTLKLNVLHYNILKNIKNNAISDNLQQVHHYSLLNSIIVTIIDVIRKTRKDKDSIKEKHMKSIAKIDEICSIDIFDEENPTQNNINTYLSALNEASNVVLSALNEASNVASNVVSSDDDEPPTKKIKEN
jgi:hypothetical protein